jgi:hypothetical protein
LPDHLQNENGHFAKKSEKEVLFCLWSMDRPVHLQLNFLRKTYDKNCWRQDIQRDDSQLKDTYQYNKNATLSMTRQHNAPTKQKCDTQHYVECHLR